MERNNFDVYGASFSRLSDGTVIVDQKKKLAELYHLGLVIQAETSRSGNKIAEPNDVTRFRRSIGRLLFIERTSHLTLPLFGHVGVKNKCFLGANVYRIVSEGRKWGRASDKFIFNVLHLEPFIGIPQKFQIIGASDCTMENILKNPKAGAACFTTSDGMTLLNGDSVLSKHVDDVLIICKESKDM